MKRYCIIYITLLFLLIAGCKKESPNNPVLLTEDIYSPAAETFAMKEQPSMDITVEKTLTFGTNSYQQVMNSSLIYQNYNSDNMLLYAEGNLSFGTYSVDIKEIKTPDGIFASFNDKMFYAQSQDSYSQIPIKLLTPDLYREITISNNKDTKTIYYSQATTAEQWALPDGYVFKSANAVVTLSNKNALLSTSYTVEYTRDKTHICDKYTVNYTEIELKAIIIPNVNNCITIENIAIPRYLEQAYGYLQQITNIDAVMTEQIDSQASSLSYDQTINISKSNTQATIQTVVSLTDSSRGNEETYSQTEKFENGQYFISTNGEEYVTQDGMDTTAINAYCQKLLCKNIPSCTYMDGYDTETSDNVITINIYSGESLAETICQNSCQTIYQDPNYLDSRSSDYEDYQVTYTITIDVDSGLPISSDLHFTGVHTIEEISYTLTTIYRQKYTYPQ